ncbi:MAG TPA: NAD(P)-dependent methylenetetrahydromethanopterin dehydrogenase [Methylibium sp.]|uniref:NAD(P)-dependent methylenetetrahydromethanopterin dehydrogenase n=1 Tax=Methylibium sp. TaxID=2067992 RepID=UPI002DC02331|nr:NAD(P)-dependent methylenetetrahydromethanopterin dehydrogenase [Methylibium sp.]HEU4459811.1 NAD(P)-dependent methylenetetrahydromethanopterin dehydrogenase [Methylibium sp.]
MSNVTIPDRRRSFDRPFVLHMFTPGKQMSPFDINMAADAGYQLLPTYSEVTLANVAGLTQDAIFSRGPKGVGRTAIFIGGRDVMLAADMMDAARRAMVPPFVVSVMADPSGSFTTAAALIACVERQLEKLHGIDLKGKRVTILGGAGTVGRIAGVLAHRVGAHVRLSSHLGLDAAKRAADETNARFASGCEGVSGADARAVCDSIADADVVLGCAAAGVQVLSAADRAGAKQLLVAADINAVPPMGLEGVGVIDSGKLLSAPGGGYSQTVGIGALAIGNVKYQTQHRLLTQMHRAGSDGEPVNLSFVEALTMAREFLAESAA